MTDGDSRRNGTRQRKENSHREEDFLRPIPHDEEAERALLGAMLISQDAATDAFGIVRAEDFFWPTHQAVFAAMREIYTNTNREIDRLLVRRELTKDGELERVGGMDFIHELMEEVPATTNAPEYAKMVRDASVLRSVLDAGSRIQDVAADPDVTPRATLARSAALVEEVRASFAGGEDAGLDGYVDLGEVLRRGVEPPEQLVPNLILAGKGHQIFGPPGEGKSWAALFATLTVMRQRKTVLYLDAENGGDTVAESMEDLGATDAELSELLRYHSSPTLTLDAAALADYVYDLDTWLPALVIIDSWADFLALAGVDENDATEVTGWWHQVVEPAKKRGAAVVLLDHVPVTSTSTRGRGSGAKLAKVDVSWQLQKIQDFDARRVGQVDLVRRKLRHGELPRRLSFAVGGCESGMIFRRADGVDEEPDPADGLTESAREALAVLQGLLAADAAGATYTDWMRASGLHENTFGRARRALVNRGLAEQNGQRYRPTLDREPTPTTTVPSGPETGPDGDDSGKPEHIETEGHPHASSTTANREDRPDSPTPIRSHATPTGVDGGSARASTPTTPTLTGGGGGGGGSGGDSDSGDRIVDLGERARRHREQLRREATDRDGPQGEP